MELSHPDAGDPSHAGHEKTDPSRQVRSVATDMLTAMADSTRVTCKPGEIVIGGTLADRVTATVKPAQSGFNQARFTELVDATFAECRSLLVVKGGEYAGSEDRLANFKRGSELTGVTPLQTLLIYMSKHYDSIATYIRDEAAGVQRPRSESMLGRVDDLINYGLLLKALIIENEESKGA